MNEQQFQKISNLHGIEFMQELLRLEEQRFEEANFRKGSTFEDINLDFGLFPATRAYPVYFAGDMREPEGKFVFLGINPGFSTEKYAKEHDFLQKRGLFEGYCRLYGDFFDTQEKNLVSYYRGIARFLRLYCGIDEKIKMDWKWFQKHLITLELVPYHSTNANGLRINDAKKYREVYFEIILRLLRHVGPQGPIFINGFRTFRTFVEDMNETLLSAFHGLIEYQISPSSGSSKINIGIGKIDGYDFIGLPFLSFPPKGGVQSVVEAVRSAVQNKDEQRVQIG